MDKYQKLQRIGEGTYGVVYKAKHREHGTILALKRIRLESEDEGELRTSLGPSPVPLFAHGQPPARVTRIFGGFFSLGSGMSRDGWHLSTSPPPHPLPCPSLSRRRGRVRVLTKRSQ